MLTLSTKANALSESPIRKLIPLANEAKKRGVHVIHLNIGQPDIVSPTEALAPLNQLQEKFIAYSPSEGYLSYRTALLGYYKRFNIHLKTDDILVTTGGSEALLFSLLAICNADDEIIIPEPFYANYNSFSTLAGAKVVPISTTIETNFALPPIEDFEAKITPQTKAILICNPNNPTGYVYSKQELEQLQILVKKHQLYLIVDEVYREFCYDNTPFFSALNLEGLEEHVIMIDSVSKRFSLCGVRIGAVVSRNTTVMNAILKMAQARLSPPSLGQIVAEASLQASDDYYAQVIKEYQARRDLLISGLKTIEGVVVGEPKGAFYCMVKLPVSNAEDFCKWLLTSFQHQGHTIMFAPANGFYSEPTSGINEVRIAYVLEQHELSLAIDCLRDALKQYIILS